MTIGLNALLAPVMIATAIVIGGVSGLALVLQFRPGRRDPEGGADVVVDDDSSNRI